LKPDYDDDGDDGSAAADIKAIRMRLSLARVSDIQAICCYQIRRHYR